jgi:hypothetical protein
VNAIRVARAALHLRLVLGIAALLSAGCRDAGRVSGSSGGPTDKIPASERIALEQAAEMELLSLEPPDAPGVRPEAKADFHGCEILGRTRVRDAAVRKELVAALEEAARDNRGEAAACFNPHHALRVTTGGRTLDFVICFECLQVRVYAGETSEEGFLITDRPRSLFDRVLRDAGVRLPAGR